MLIAVTKFLLSFLLPPHFPYFKADKTEHIIAYIAGKSTETENKALTEDEISTEDSETVTPFIAGKPGDKVWTKNMSGTNGYTLATLELVTYGSQYPDGYKIIESWREGVLGANGEEIFCMNPMAAFSEVNIKNVYNATDFFTQKEITS